MARLALPLALLFAFAPVDAQITGTGDVTGEALTWLKERDAHCQKTFPGTHYSLKRCGCVKGQDSFILGVRQKTLELALAENPKLLNRIRACQKSENRK